MLEFLNASLFEKLINCSLIQDSSNPEKFTFWLCVFKMLLMWPLSHFFYQIIYTITYYINLHTANYDDLRSSRVKRFCYQDFWRDYWNNKHFIYGLKPTLTYECDDCTACDKGNARCKYLFKNSRKLRAFYNFGYVLSIFLAFIVANPFTVFYILGIEQGIRAVCYAILINPLFIYISHIPFYDRNIVLIKKKLYDKYAHVFEEMEEDGALDRYHDKWIPSVLERRNSVSVDSSPVRQQYESGESSYDSALQRQRANDICRNIRESRTGWWW